jgi:chromosome segregation ATPase
MTEPASHTLAYLRRLDDKFDQLHGAVGELRAEVGGLRTEVGEIRTEVSERLGRIEDELLVLNGIALRLEGREVETTGLKAILDRHERRLAELGRQVSELENSGKD